MMGVQESADVEMTSAARDDGVAMPTTAAGTRKPCRAGIAERIQSSSSSSNGAEYTNHQRVARRSHSSHDSTISERTTTKRIKENETPSFSNTTTCTVSMETTTTPIVNPAQLPSSDDILIEVGVKNLSTLEGTLSSALSISLYSSQNSLVFMCLVCQCIYR
jgi:hypothetical protein